MKSLLPCLYATMLIGTTSTISIVLPPSSRSQGVDCSFPIVYLDEPPLPKPLVSRARELREAALAKLSDKDRKFVFEWAAELTKNFGPQLPRDKDTEKQLKNDRAFCAFMYETFDWAKFAGSARALLALTDADYLKE